MIQSVSNLWYWEKMTSFSSLSEISVSLESQTRLTAGRFSRDNAKHWLGACKSMRFTSRSLALIMAHYVTETLFWMGEEVILQAEHRPDGAAKKGWLTLDTVRPDVPPVLRAHLLVLDQVVADGHAAVRVGLHEGDGRQALGDGGQAHRVRVGRYVWRKERTMTRFPTLIWNATLKASNRSQINRGSKGRKAEVSLTVWGEMAACSHFKINTLPFFFSLTRAVLVPAVPPQLSSQKP